MGPTQSYKTSSLAIPVLLEWPGCAVVTSVKGDLLEATRLARWREGEVLVFDPAGLLGVDGATWNPLAGVTSWRQARELARWLTEASAETKELGDATKGFFEQRGERPLAAAVWAAVLAGHPIGQVRRWIDAMGEQAPGDPRDPTTAARYNDAAEDILKILTDYEVDTGKSQEDAILALKSIMDEDPRQRSGTITSAQAALDVFADEHVERACTPGQLDGGQIDPERLLNGSNTLYLFAPLHEQERLRPVMEALVMSVVRTAMERTARTRTPLDVRLLVLLDEAGNVAPVRALAQLASTGAGQGIQLMSVFQDGAQVRHRYGRQAATVINNHRAKLILSGLSDPDSLELVSRLIGDSAEVEESTTTAEDRRSQTEHVAYRRLAPPSLLRSIRPGEGVLLYGHLPACRLRLRWWIKDKDLARRAGPDEERRSVNGQHPRGRPRGNRRIVDLARYRRQRRVS
jgi:type IV secretory pathway TraG/TraD family ATPase VirD4